MTYPNHRIALLTAGLTLLGVPTFAQSPAAKEEIIQLPSFSVSEIPADRYRSTDAGSAARIRSNVADTAGSISVLTPEFLQDVAPTRIYDATRYVAGISEGRGDGFADRQMIRGFENTLRTVDNFGSIQGENVDALFVDRVEVVKGPSSILAPTGAPGGAINVVGKRPLYRTERSLAVTVGLIDAQRADLDLTGAFAPNSPAAYRVLAGYQDGRLASSGTKDKKKLIGGSVSFRLSPRTTLTVRGNYEERWVFVYLPVFISSASVNGGDAILAPGFNYGNNRNGTESWAHRGGRYMSSDLLLTSTLGDHISTRLAAKAQYNVQRDMFMAASLPGLGNRYNPATGQQTPDQIWTGSGTTFTPANSPYFDVTNIQRQPFLPTGQTQDYGVQYDIAGSYRFEGITSTTVVGAALDHQVAGSQQLTGPFLPFNLLAPVYGAQPVFTTFQTRSTGASTSWQYYVNEQLGFAKDRVLVTLGGVRVTARTRNTNQLNNVSARLNDGKNLGLAGLVVKPVKGLSLYLSRSVNATPTIANSLPLWQEGKQWEFGAKYSALNDRLSLTAAHFQISQTNVTVPNPAFQSDATQPQTLVSDLKNHGYEFELAGSLTKNLSAVASATFLEMADSLGRPVRAVAKRNGGLFLNYRFSEGDLKGFTLFGGLTYTGARPGEVAAINFTQLRVVAQPSFYLAPVTLVNLGGRYTWDKLTFALNIDNALDKHYIGIPTARGNAGIGLPRNVRLTTTYKF